MDFVTVENGPTKLNVAVKGEGPLILCVHGWPETWSSFRPQIEHFSPRGYRVAAMDVRGYGASSCPPEIAAYSLLNLARDAVAVIDALGGGPAILFGHDWGAPIVWNTAVLHPEKVSAVAGLSVPYAPRGRASHLGVLRRFYADRFFYQLYFQAQGVGEAELEADPLKALRMIYYAASGEPPLNDFLMHKPADAKLLDGMLDPSPGPVWMSGGPFLQMVDSFRRTGFRGALNRYRAQDIDFVDLAPYEGAPIIQPSFFVAGERDPVRAFIPGRDLYADPGAACMDFRGSVVIPGAGHWLEYEAPEATNAALAKFIASL